MTASIALHIAQAQDALDGYNRKGQPAVVFLLADLLFYCRAKRIDFRAALQAAQRRFRTLKVAR